MFTRHGEKRAQSFGQLSCQGLNRALALPDVLLKKFGTPAAIFAPDPSKRITDHGKQFDYVRPLVTIEPTAIRLEMPVNTQYGFEDLQPLQDALTAKEYQDTTLFVAWEHRMIVKLLKQMIKHYGGNPDSIPAWAEDDFDSIYIVTLGQNTMKLTQDKEGLNQQSTLCPGPRAL